MQHQHDRNDRQGKDRAAHKRPTKARKISREYLQKAALFYLDRYNGTRSSVRALLWRRIENARRAGGELADDAQLEAWITEIITKLEALGLLDDQRFAHNRAQSLLQSGDSLALVRAKLQQKGVATDDIDSALGTLIDDEGAAQISLRAAQAYVKKRRLGLWRLDAQERQLYRDRDLAALARRGFSYAIAIKALDLCEQEP